jgi:HrpA-like RNA helicase
VSAYLRMKRRSWQKFLTKATCRSTVIVDEECDVVGYGDASTKKEAEHLAAFDGLLQLVKRDLLDRGLVKGKKKPKSKGVTDSRKADSGTSTPKSNKGPTVTLSEGSIVTAEKAREFMSFYCTHFKYVSCRLARTSAYLFTPKCRFGPPNISFISVSKPSGKKGNLQWSAEMRVGGAMIGKAEGTSKKDATSAVYLDALRYIEEISPKLWIDFPILYRPGAVVSLADPVQLTTSEQLEEDITNICDTVRATYLFANRPKLAGRIQAGEAAEASGTATPTHPRLHGKAREYRADNFFLERKSGEMMMKLQDYQVDPRMRQMRTQRTSLPVQERMSDVLVKIELNQVTVVMAATGSGKTTQLPQMILDDYIMQRQGAMCNVIVTQPRRIAAISVAHRVAAERGETVGQTVGYSVRFDQRPAEKHGSINFCTTGVFLRQLQSTLTEGDTGGYLDYITHIVVDEVHERDIETDLLLIILRRIMAQRRKEGKTAFKVILMSATIDPSLFCQYFASPTTMLPAPVVDVAGRSYPVDRHYLEETYQRLKGLHLPIHAGGWIWQEKNVQQYIEREMKLAGAVGFKGRGREEDQQDVEVDLEKSLDPMELPYPFIGLMIADIIMESDDGHVLVFLPGWEEIKAVRAILEDPSAEKRLMGIDFRNTDRFEVHVLHSSVPVEDQQAVFEPVRRTGLRRIILATNIAETSITIPDVVYVIDSAKSKENHYDPDRHLQSLSSAWVGTSNVNQRAGRAGRHRAGHAYSLLTTARYNSLKPSSMVAMKRENLSNIVMNIKAMNIAGADVEKLLAESIEPPAPERVQAAVESLVALGALDGKKELTSLGQVLAKMPIDAPMAKMCLYGAFFRCLDSALSLAAILTERSPWVMAEAIRQQAVQAKESWSHPQFRSDALTTLRAFKRFEELVKRGQHHEVGRFLSANYLHRGAMQTILQIKEQLFEAMRSLGIFNAVLSQSGDTRGYQSSRINIFMPDLNANSASLPLLTALVAMASTPKFALRIKENVFRTSQDKKALMETTSVNNPKVTGREKEYKGSNDLYAYQAKTTSSTHQSAPPMLRGITILDPLTFMLFGASRLAPGPDGSMLCDGWLPVLGDMGALDEVDRLKIIMEVCMLRVFEAIEPEAASSNGAVKTLSEIEASEFDRMSNSIVKVLEKYSEERNEEMAPPTASQADIHSLNLLSQTRISR